MPRRTCPRMSSLSASSAASVSLGKRGCASTSGGRRRRRGGLVRERELKRRAASCVSVRPQTTAMRLDDGPADREPHAGALGLGGEECAEDLVYVLSGEPHASILDGDQQLAIP